MDDLIPCRCGCASQTIRRADFQPDGLGTKYTIFCESCGVKTFAYDLLEAKEKWNRMQDIANVEGEEVVGFSKHRLIRDDPYHAKECKLHDTFNLFIKRDKRFWDFMLGTNSSGTRPADYLSNRELRIVATTIQWLGTPVGQGFLREAGIIE